jgi:uncharacterized iron-regulated membrane protein
MIGFVLLLSSLTLLGAGVAWWRRRPEADSSPARTVSAAVSRALDLFPEGGNGEGENGLAAFYAYQMAVSKIDRV